MGARTHATRAAVRPAVAAPRVPPAGHRVESCTRDSAGAARRRLHDEHGFTLMELLVTMVMLGAVSLLVVSAMAQAARTYLHAEDEVQGLADAKTVLDRVARDIREARGVVCPQDTSDPRYSTADPQCAAHLQLWIDEDSDYTQDATEVVGWELQPNGEHFDVLRVGGDGSTHVVARSLIVQTLFRYDTANPEQASLVDLTMHYDALIGVGVDIRTAQTASRLRNA